MFQIMSKPHPTSPWTMKSMKISSSQSSLFNQADSEPPEVQVAGKVITDMTFLREEGKILPIFPVADHDGVIRGKPHYRVEHDLVPIVKGRNLRYEARYLANQFGKCRSPDRSALLRPFCQALADMGFR